MKRLLVALLLCLLPVSAAAGVIRGRVVLDEKPLVNMSVAAYANLDFSGNPLAVSAPTGSDGMFRLEVPDGEVALFARDEARRLFAFCGRNPLRSGAEELWAGLQAVPLGPVQKLSYDDAYTAGIEGTVTFAGKPEAGAVVYLYLDTTDALKGQGYRMSPPTGDDGRFYFDGLPESGFFLAARKRKSGETVGPVLAGDLFGIFPGNPLQVRSGEALQVTLPLVAKLKEAAGSETFGHATGTALSGRVLDSEGKPAAGMHVFAYTNRVIGHQRPAALSAPTGDDGRFRVELPAGGTYYVGARDRYGDSPAPGERFGLYDGSADHGLQVAAGEQRGGLQITVAPIDLGGQP